MQKRSKLIRASAGSDGAEERLLGAGDEPGKKRKHSGHRDKHVDAKKHKSNKLKAQAEQVPMLSQPHHIFPCFW